MKIAVTSTGPTLEDMVEARFGRSAYFLIIDPGNLEFEAMENTNVSLGGGAGPQSAQLMANKGVSVVLTGNCGPNAFRTFGAAGIRVITGVSGQARQVVKQFNSGKLDHSASPNAQDQFAMGTGSGKGKGMGRGRGVGGRRGMSA
jgi:predicted Fe-Mo cluster-binding NifX family protein